MNDWVVESPSFEEQLMNNRITYLNQKGIDEVVELIDNKDKEIERLKEEYMILQNAGDEVEEDLQQRIDKAIEYIEKHIVATETENILLDILKRVDKECKK